MHTPPLLPLQAQRGAALLMAMIILTLVATLAAGMMYQQDRAIRVESAERAHAQTSRVARGGLELARWILRQDMIRNPATDHLGEAWATQLPETELSTLISGNERSATEQPVLRAFMRGSITDAQSRFNLYNLVTDKNEIDPRHLAALRLLCGNAGLPAETADRIAAGLKAAWSPQLPQPDTPVAPLQLSQLGWIGIEPGVVKVLRPWVDLLPERTSVNINTASPAVLSAMLNIESGSAQRLAEARSRSPGNTGLQSIPRIKEILGPGIDDRLLLNLDVKSDWFEVDATLRIGDEFTRQVWLLKREDRTVRVRREQRIPLDDGSAS